MTVPAEAVEAAARALAELPTPDNQFEADRWRIVSRIVLEAAAPFIARAQREADAQLADKVDAAYTERIPCKCGRKGCGAILRPHVPFADLLRLANGTPLIAEGEHA